MVTIQFNDQFITIPKDSSLSQLLIQQQYVDTYFAVAVNQELVPRSTYTEKILKAGDVINIITPMQGG